MRILSVGHEQKEVEARDLRFEFLGLIFETSSKRAYLRPFRQNKARGGFPMPPWGVRGEIRL